MEASWTMSMCCCASIVFFPHAKWLISLVIYSHVCCGIILTCAVAIPKELNLLEVAAALINRLQVSPSKSLLVPNLPRYFLAHSHVFGSAVLHALCTCWLQVDFFLPALSILSHRLLDPPPRLLVLLDRSIGTKFQTVSPWSACLSSACTAPNCNSFMMQAYWALSKLLPCLNPLFLPASLIHSLFLLFLQAYYS